MTDTTAKASVRLYVMRGSVRSTTAERSVRYLCEGTYGAACALEVIDIAADPGTGEAAGVLAVPTLIVRRGGHAFRAIGDMQDVTSLEEWLVHALGVEPLGVKR